MGANCIVEISHEVCMNECPVVAATHWSAMRSLHEVSGYRIYVCSSMTNRDGKRWRTADLTIGQYNTRLGDQSGHSIAVRSTRILR